jgi:hypothetical protein
MGRFRVGLLDMVTTRFDRAAAADSIVRRMGTQPPQILEKILDNLETEYNRAAFEKAIGLLPKSKKDHMFKGGKK